MDVFFVLFLIAAVIFFVWYMVYANRSKRLTMKAIESNDKVTESNNRLADAINHLADVIQKK